MRYEAASPNPKQTGCQTGTRALGLAIKAIYPELEAMTAVFGCYNRRRVAGSARWSLHAEGRALDVGVSPRQNAVGWELACELVQHRLVYGTMRVIWDGHIWSLEQGPDWRELKPGSEPHRDHLHIEQFWDAATRPAAVQPVLERSLKR